LVLLDDAETESTLMVLERLRASLANAPISLEDGTEITQTASFGAAEINKDETIEKTIERADAALYRAKEAGRNRIKLATDED
jgi:diguanylate cyclase (GGDEF)-like protein